MSEISRDEYNPVKVISSQHLAQVQKSIQSLIPYCDDQVALVVIGLQFSQSTPLNESQEGAEAICTNLRSHVRGSDQIYLLQHKSGRYGLFYILPDADLEGGQVVHQRLQDVLSSSILHLVVPAPQHSEIRTYALSKERNQASLLIESSTYTNMVVQNATPSVQIIPTQLNVQRSQKELFFPLSTFLLSEHCDSD